MLKHLYFFILLAGITISSPLYAEETTESPYQKGSVENVSFGVLTNSRLPFWGGDKTAPIGMQHDATLLLAKALNFDVDYKEYNSIVALHNALETGEVSAVIGFTVDDNWPEKLPYSRALYREPLVAWTLETSLKPEGFSEINWGCVKGTSGCASLTRGGYNNVTQVSDHNELYQGLIQSKFDAIVDVYSAVVAYEKKNPDLVSRTFFYEDLGFYEPRVVGSPESLELIRDINGYLAQVQENADNPITEILKQYDFPLIDQTSFVAQASQTEIIRYTINENVFPLSYYDNVRGKYVGFIHDLMSKMSRNTPLEFIYVPPNGRSIDQMLIDGDVDILPAVNVDLVQNDKFIKTSVYTSVKYSQIETNSDYEIKKVAVLDRINILPLELIDTNIRVYRDIQRLINDIGNGEVTNAYLNEYLVASILSADSEKRFDLLLNASKLNVELAMVARDDHIRLAATVDNVLRSFSQQEINDIWSRYQNVQLKWDLTPDLMPKPLLYSLVAISALLIGIFYWLYLRMKKNVEITQEVVVTAQTQNKWLNQLINSIPSMICIFDDQGEVVLANKKYKDIMHDCGFDNPKDLIDFIFEGLDITLNDEFEKNVHIPDNFSPLSGRSYFLVNSELEVQLKGQSQYLLVLNDITTLKTRENSLIEANKQVIKSIEAQNHFLAVISHELRTPISAMLGLMEILNNRISIYEDRVVLENAIDSANRLKLLVNDILDYSKLDAKQVKISADRCNLAKELGNLLRGYEASANQKGVDLHLEWIPTKYLEAKIDIMRLSQIVSNVLSNAVKFTNKGFISVSIRTSVDELYISVRDTGIGMSREQLQTIFDPFVQAEESISRHYGGTGLGMSIVSNLISLMEGRIAVNSETNLGTLVELSFPIEGYETELNLTHRVTIEQPQASVWLDLFSVDYLVKENGLSKDQNIYPDLLMQSVLTGSDAGIVESEEDLAPINGNILVVEDDLINRFLVDKQLVEFGLKVTLASSGKEALNYLEETIEPYDLVLTDCHMPEMSGYELAAKIRRSAAGSTNIPIVALTADNTPGVEDKAIEAGIDEVMYKPYDLNQLHRVLNYYLNLRPTVSQPSDDVSSNLAWLDKFEGKQKFEMAVVVVASLTDCITYFQADDADIKATAHRVKGAAGALGIEALFEMATKLEITPNDHDLKERVVGKIIRTIEEAQRYINSNKENTNEVNVN